MIRMQLVFDNEEEMLRIGEMIEDRGIKIRLGMNNSKPEEFYVNIIK